MDKIVFPDGFNGGTVECECDPIQIEGDLYKLQVKNKPFTKWCTKEQWQEAMTEAYEQEVSASYFSEYPRLIAEEYRREEIRKEIFGD